MPEVIKTILTADSSDLRAEFGRAAQALSTYQQKQTEGFSKALAGHQQEIAALRLQKDGFTNLAASLRETHAIKEAAVRLAASANISEEKAIAILREKLVLEKQIASAAQQAAAASSAASSRAAAIANPRATGLPGGGGLAPLTPQSLQAMDRAIAQTRELSRQTLLAGQSGKNGALGFLAFSQAVEDAQFGVKGILNNIPQMIMGFGGGAGLAGAISLLAVAGYAAWQAFEKLSGTEAMVKWAKTSTEAVAAMSNAIRDNAAETLKLAAARESLAATQELRGKEERNIERTVGVDGAKYQDIANRAAETQRARQAEDANQSAAAAATERARALREEIAAARYIPPGTQEDTTPAIRQTGEREWEAAKLKYTTEQTRANQDLATAQQTLNTVQQDWEKIRAASGDNASDLASRRRAAAAAEEEARRLVSAREAEKAAVQIELDATKAGSTAQRNTARYLEGLEKEITAQKILQDQQKEQGTLLDQLIQKNETSTDASLQALDAKKAALQQEIQVLTEAGRTRDQLAKTEAASIKEITQLQLEKVAAERAAKDAAAAPARADAGAVLKEMELRRQGNSEKAEALREEVALRKQASEEAAALNLSEAQALANIRELNAQTKELAQAVSSLPERQQQRQQDRSADRERAKEDARARNAFDEKLNIPRTNEEKKRAKERQDNKDLKPPDKGDEKNSFKAMVDLQKELVTYFKQLGIA